MFPYMFLWSLQYNNIRVRMEIYLPRIVIIVSALVPILRILSQTKKPSNEFMTLKILNIDQFL